MRIFVDGATALICAQASIPERRGIHTSMRTTSGSSSSTRSTPRPRRRPPHDVEVVLDGQDHLQSPAEQRVVVHDDDPDRLAHGAPSPVRAGPDAGGPLPGRRSWHGRHRAPPPGYGEWRPVTESVGQRMAAATTAVSAASEAARPFAAPSAEPSCGRLLDVEVDDAVVPARAPVHHARRPAGGVDEQVEVVPDELHLVEGLVQGHRDRVVPLLADDDGRGVLHGGLGRVGRGRGRTGHDRGRGCRVAADLLGQRATGVEGPRQHLVRQAGRGLVDGGGPVPAVVHLAAVAGAPQPFEELGGGEVERRVGIVGAGLGAHDRSLVAHGDLHPFAIARLPTVVLVGNLDVDALGAGRELADLRLQLVLDVPPEPLLDVGVPSVTTTSTGCLPRSSWRHRHVGPARLGPSPRAADHPRGEGAVSRRAGTGPGVCTRDVHGGDTPWDTVAGRHAPTLDPRRPACPGGTRRPPVRHPSRAVHPHPRPLTRPSPSARRPPGHRPRAGPGRPRQPSPWS